MIFRKRNGVGSCFGNSLTRAKRHRRIGSSSRRSRVRPCVFSDRTTRESRIPSDIAPSIPLPAIDFRERCGDGVDRREGSPPVQSHTGEPDGSGSFVRDMEQPCHLRPFEQKRGLPLHAVRGNAAAHGTIKRTPKECVRAYIHNETAVQRISRFTDPPRPLPMRQPFLHMIAKSSKLSSGLRHLL